MISNMGIRYLPLTLIYIPVLVSCMETLVIDGNLGTEYQNTVNNSFQIIYQFNISASDLIGVGGSNNALRAYAQSDDLNPEEPVTIVVKQRKGVLSWELPYMVGTDSYNFAYRTLCPYETIKTLDKRMRLVGGNLESETETVTISVSTTNKKNVGFKTQLYIQNPFQLKMNQTYNLRKDDKKYVLSPSSPIFYYYEFEAKQDSALIKLESEDTICMILSIQDASCPVLDLNRNIKFAGTYETIDKLGGIYFSRSMVSTKGVYIVLMVKDSDLSCHELPRENFTLASNELSFDDIIPRRKQVKFTVTNKITQQEYWIATFGAIGMFFGAYVIVFIVSIGAFIHSSRRSTRQTLIEDREPIFQNIEESVISSASPNQYHTALDDHHVLSSNPTDHSFERSPSPPKEEADNIQVANTNEDAIETAAKLETSNGLIHPLSDDSSLDEIDIDMLQDADFEKDVFRTKITLHVSDLARKSSRVLSKKSNLYFYTLGTIAIFYGLPVIQLVLTYQQLTNNNGNKDICYYNFLCAHPLGKLSDFNHVFSNLGYIMLGVLFMICTRRKQTVTKRQHEEANPRLRGPILNSTRKIVPEPQFGIPQHFGMYYAMGLGLIMEGFMSACYHVCPSHINFQFDTAFMYTIAILILLKIYQTRHPDINASAYRACLALAFVIFLSVIGVKYGSGNQYFWAFFTALHVITCMVLSLQVYYMGRFRLNLGIFKRTWITIRNDAIAIYSGQWYGLKPLYPTRMVLLLMMNIVNWGLSIFGAVNEASKKNADFASFLLAILISNVMLYTCFYIVMKLRHGERITCQPAFYLILSVFTWAGAGYFFFNNSTSWKLSPAESRQLNTECKLFHFYGKIYYSHFKLIIQS